MSDMPGTDHNADDNLVRPSVLRTVRLPGAAAKRRHCVSDVPCARDNAGGARRQRKHPNVAGDENNARAARRTREAWQRGAELLCAVHTGFYRDAVIHMAVRQ